MDKINIKTILMVLILFSCTDKNDKNTCIKNIDLLKSKTFDLDIDNVLVVTNGFDKYDLRRNTLYLFDYAEFIDLIPHDIRDSFKDLKNRKNFPNFLRKTQVDSLKSMYYAASLEDLTGDSLHPKESTYFGDSNAGKEQNTIYLTRNNKIISFYSINRNYKKEKIACDEKRVISFYNLIDKYLITNQKYIKILDSTNKTIVGY